MRSAANNYYLKAMFPFGYLCSSHVSIHLMLPLLSEVKCAVNSLPSGQLLGSPSLAQEDNSKQVYILNGGPCSTWVNI